MTRFRAIIAVFCAAVSPAAAEEVAIAPETGGVYVVDTATGAVRSLAPTQQFFDIALDSMGQLWGVTGAGVVYRKPAAAEVPTAVGPTGVFLNGLVVDDRDRLFGSGGSWIYRVDRSSGLAIPLAEIRGFQSSGDLAAAPGLLYATSMGPGGDDLFAFDPDTGEGWHIGQVGFRDVYGLIWDGSGLIGFTASRLMIRIDPDTGRGTLMGPIDVPGAAYGAARMRELVSG